MIALWLAKFKTQLIALGVAGLVCLGLYLYVSHLNSVIDKQVTQISNITGERDRANADLKRANEVRDIEKKNRELAEHDLTYYLDINKRIQDENDKFTKCIADGSCGVQLRKPTSKTLPTVSSAGPTTCSPETTGTGLDQATQYNISVLRRDTRIVLNLLDICIKDNARKSGLDVNS